MLQPVEEAGWCQGGGGWGITTSGGGWRQGGGGGGVTASGGGRMVSGWGSVGCYSQWRRQDGVRVGEVVVLQPVEEAG